jgi:hypothetical protein
MTARIRPTPRALVAVVMLLLAATMAGMVAAAVQGAAATAPVRCAAGVPC